MYCKPAIATISLGQAGLHDIRDKLREAAACGLGGIELFYDDLEALARLLSTDTCSIVRPPSRHNIQEAARTIRDLCDDLHLVILNLQPFRFYEGLVDRAETARLQEQVLPLWLEIIQILGTSTILVASNFLGPDPVTGKARTHSGRLDVIVDDLRDMADPAALCSPPVRIAYEAIAWGNEINKWEQAWEVVQLVDRPNFGLALDTFNMAAAVFADPTTETGMIEDSAASAQSGMQATLHRMATELDMTKVFVVQIADGERLAEPLRSGHPFYVAGQPPRMSWSRNARLFLCEPERGCYLPVVDVVRLLVEQLGWRGWLSYEVFSRTLADPSPETPATHAARAARSWQNLIAVIETEGGNLIRERL
ncbi:xylose isomerase-like protein [Apiospora arundinis]|uniref:Xylose isomerase-like protein n=1 Tax=Apiospora arundinis TaxID=335852 RepID=A0ABR2HJS2_9PEZI